MISGSRSAWARIASTVEGAGVSDLVATRCQPGPDPGDDDAVAVADADDADDLEGDERLAEGGTADAEAGGELALRGEPVADRRGRCR